MTSTDETQAGPPAPPPSPQERQAAVDRLCEHFARDALTAGELERRLGLAYAARTRAELAGLEHDLPALASKNVPAPPPPSVVIDPTRRAPERDLVVSVWGGTERKGSWTPARTLTAITVMGGAELDFREAVFATREVRVHVVAVMGGIEVVVPPGVRVEWAGVALMGGVSTPERMEPDTPDGPVVRISGLVLMGGVEVAERLRGETKRQAKKRLKRLKKARRRLGTRAL